MTKMVLTQPGFFSTVRLPEPEQRTFNGVETPLVLQCTKNDATISETADWVNENQAELERLVHHHGAVLFRGFALDGAPEFDKFVHCFKGWDELPYEESLSYAVRLKVEGTKRVCTSNEGKNGGLTFHHEQAQAPLYPSKVFFYCQDRDMNEPGGATGICPSSEVYRRVKAKYPEFIEQITEHGVQYSSLVGQHPDPDPSKGVGRGWDTFFGQQCNTKEEVEARMRELGYTWQWVNDEGLLKTTTPTLSAVRKSPGSGRDVFFNQIPAMIANAIEFTKGHGGDPSLDQFCVAGDGSSLDINAVQYAKDQSEATAIELEWRPGDVCILDNFEVMHARRIFEGNKRRLLASLTKHNPGIKARL